VNFLFAEFNCNQIWIVLKGLHLGGNVKFMLGKTAREASGDLSLMNVLLCVKVQSYLTENTVLLLEKHSCILNKEKIAVDTELTG